MANKSKYTLQEVTSRPVGARIPEPAQTHLQRQPQLGVPARRGYRKGLRSRPQSALRRRRSDSLAGTQPQERGGGAHRRLLQPRTGGHRGAADRRLRLFRGDQRPGGRRPALRRGAHVAGQPRHGGHGRPDQLRPARHVVGTARRRLRIPAPLRQPLQSALLQGAVRTLRVPQLLQPEHLHLAL